MLTEKYRTLQRRKILNAGLQLGSLIALSPVIAACNRQNRGLTGTVGQKFASYRSYDALGLAELVSDGYADPAELLDIAIARIEQVDPQLNFMAVPMYERAREAIRRGLPKGVFRGVPFLLKDLSIHLQGEIITSGSRLFKNERSTYTSTLAERYIKNGLVIFGRTTSPEMGSSVSTESTLHGKTRNPWKLSISAGGSSGGSAAAVASGVLPCAHASDGGGSIRIPASCCGLYGFKPSRGRVPYGPRHLEGADSLSCMHVVSRTVRDSAAMLDISRGSEPGSPYVAAAPKRPYLEEIRIVPRKLRIAVMSENAFSLPVHPDCLKALHHTEQLCRDLGHTTENIGWPKGVTGAEAGEAMGTLMGTNSLLAVQNYLQRHGRKKLPLELLEPINAFRLDGLQQLAATNYLQARQTLWRLSRLVALHFADYDMVLSPTMAAPPPKLGLVALTRDFEGFSRDVLPYACYTAIYNITGQPAVSLPLFWNSDDVPIGTMFSAPINREDQLFGLSAQLERANPWFDRIPPV